MREIGFTCRRRRRSPALTTSRHSLAAGKSHRVISLEYRQLTNFTTRMTERPFVSRTGNCAWRCLHTVCGVGSLKRSAFKVREVQVPERKHKKRAQVRSPPISNGERSHRQHGAMPSISQVIITVSKISVTTRKRRVVSSGPTASQA